MSGSPWTHEEIELVRECFAFTPTRDIAGALRRPAGSVGKIAAQLGIRKDPELIRLLSREAMQNPYHGGRAHRFRKGQNPPNKGRKMPGYAPGRMAQTQFRAGQTSWNWKPIGSRRMVDGYDYTKVSDVRHVPYTVNWKPTHLLLWQQTNGPIPPAHVLVFRDGDRTHIALDNLELISRADLARRNSIHNLPAELVEVIRLKGTIRSIITKRRKKDAAKQNV